MNLKNGSRILSLKISAVLALIALWGLFRVWQNTMETSLLIMDSMKNNAITMADASFRLGCYSAYSKPTKKDFQKCKDLSQGANKKLRKAMGEK